MEPTDDSSGDWVWSEEQTIFHRTNKSFEQSLLDWAGPTTIRKKFGAVVCVCLSGPEQGEACTVSISTFSSEFATMMTRRFPSQLSIAGCFLVHLLETKVALAQYEHHQSHLLKGQEMDEQSQIQFD